MPEVGETGWGQLVSNNFEILDIILNTFNTNIGNGTRILVIPLQNPTTITTSNFGKYAFYDENNVYIAPFDGNITFSSIPKPPHSCRLMIISVNGDATISGNIDTYPTTLQNELPPGTPETNTYTNNISLADYYICKITLTYTADQNNSILNMNQQDYLNFINNTIPYTLISTIKYSLSIPHAIAAGGGGTIYGNNGTSGTASNTCNGGGGGILYNHTAGGYSGYAGSTGCIFGQYSGGDSNRKAGYGAPANNKYRCALVIIANGNITITGKITQTGGNGSSSGGGYGGGAYYPLNNTYAASGGGGAPVFIYYTGTYTNNGTINTSGGNGYKSDDKFTVGTGGAGGIKTTKITF